MYLCLFILIISCYLFLYVTYNVDSSVHWICLHPKISESNSINDWSLSPESKYSNSDCLYYKKCTAPQTAVISDQTEGFWRGWSNNQNNPIDVNWIYASFTIEVSYLRNLLLLCFKPSVSMTLMWYFPYSQLLFLSLRPYLMSLN